MGEKFVLEREALLNRGCAVLLLGGEPPRSPRLKGLIRRAPFVAAADAGAAVGLEAGRLPELLVGDFDSLPPELLERCRAGGSEVVRLPVHKDLTDGEFILDWAAREAGPRGWRRLVVLGALGGRLDQTLANILCALPLAAAGLELCFAGEGELVLLLCAGEGAVQRLELRGFAGRTVSLLALGGDARRVELAGFSYPLAGPLALGVSLGVSNIAEGPRSEIALSGGRLLVSINDWQD